MNKVANEQCYTCPAVEWCGTKIEAYQSQIVSNDARADTAEMGEIAAKGRLIIAADEFSRGEQNVQGLEAWELLASMTSPDSVEQTAEESAKSAAYWQQRIVDTENDLAKILDGCDDLHLVTARIKQRIGITACGSTSSLAKKYLKAAEAKRLFGKPT